MFEQENRFYEDDYWKPVIESASPEEIAMCDERLNNPV